MEKKSSRPTDNSKPSSFRVEGKIEREKSSCEEADLKLVVYVFDQAGVLLGNSPTDQKGNYNVRVKLAEPRNIQLFVAPEGDPKLIRQSGAFQQQFMAKDWQGQTGKYQLNFDAIIPQHIWLPWLPKRICVSGHIRKVVTQNGNTNYCPVPYVKVEVFDVDRQPCWWPPLKQWWKYLLDKPVFRIPDLLRNPPFPPRPLPDPAPDFNLPFSTLGALRLNTNVSKLSLSGDESNNQKLLEQVNLNSNRLDNSRVGEMARIDPELAARLEKLTLTSKIAPWRIFPHCFYSKQLICEITTDCNGFFNCCFDWWPFHFRNGRLSFDSRPDIIIRVTQVINGVETVIYMDPYTSTRWNSNSTHIDLFLDNDEVVCGNGHCPQSTEGSPVFFTRVGNDEVYQINQTLGLYNDTTYSNVAYGSGLNIHAQFGDDLTASDPGSVTPPPYYFYRLSYAKQGSNDVDFKFIDADLNDTRVSKNTLIASSHKLGPYTVNGVPSLYEVRNFNRYYWYNPDWVGIWNTLNAETDTGKYNLRLEVFDKNGVKQSTAAGTVDYRNGAGIGNGIPPSPLPPMIDHCDLVITLDNKPPVAALTIPSVTNDCGVIPWTSVPPLNFLVNASQENNRLRGWQLRYTKGVGSEQTLAQQFSNNGLPGSFINHSVNGNSLLTGLTSTCAFALRLRAWAHIRNGVTFIYYDEDIDAIAIEKCQGQ